ncbi:hypothetical protein ACFXPN_42530 [Streptomyces griseorubiginosus]|uniref:hypothetical protein n=1 Tax=Streptomyces griseorubiginosus TaxID=67304 RepID=UPI0036A55D6C
MITRLLFGAALGLLLLAFPAAPAVVLTAAVEAMSQPPVLVAAAGVILWPRVSRRVRRWAR